MPASFLSYSDSDGQHNFVLDGASVSIGRSPDRDMVLHETLVSRHHAVITREGDNWTVSDENSTHGTFLNGARIQNAVLKPGDVLQIGSLTGKKLRFVVESDEQVTGPLKQTSFHDLLSSIQEMPDTLAGIPPAAREIELLNWLLRAARQLNEGEVIDEILGALLHLTLQLTGAERGFVFLWADRKLHFAKGLDSAGEVLAQDQSISQKAIENAINSRRKFSVSDTSTDERVMGWSSVMMNDIRRIHCVPLRKRVAPKEPDKLLGLLYLDSRIAPGDLSEIDHLILDTVSAEAAALLQNALLVEAEQKARQAREELAVAARIHSGLMSIALPVLPYASLQAKTVPCLAIGGDFYDAVVLDDCVCVTLVDVSGKGISAAIVAATLQGIVHAQLAARQDLSDIATAVNRFLCERNIGKYATMVIVKLYPDGQLEYINCGHILPLVIRGKQIRRLEDSNLMVGLFAEAIYASAKTVLLPGERLVIASDGITEAENSKGRQFEESWLSVVTHCPNIGEILDQVAKFQAPNPAQDDCTLVEVRYNGNE
ncbi:SpoIIE family protein phosphatase [Acidicapsa acidisoli]|uniref:SpoIIE family protein phosphatase n=1 Tax=Acidicapsa acidisoli TaxID=1615681 RepID=UPI0021E0EEC9|nr:SpoIIE family protein phosphatase [Acidicapsa acidisoli]